jgi:sarcosine oxidase gamma subunit
MPLDGGLHSVATTLAGEDVSLLIAVQGKPAIDELEALLAAERVYYSPVGGTAGWFAPGSWRVVAPAPEVKVLTITMVRQDWPPTDPPEAFL